MARLERGGATLHIMGGWADTSGGVG
jgi:hypothetical protein